MPRLDLLEALSKELRAYRPNGLKFDMNFWKQETTLRDNSCRTTCCAMGLGMLRVPAFLDVFKFVLQGKDKYEIATNYEVVLKDYAGKEQTFRGNDFLIGQLATGFGIDTEEADDIFMPLRYRTTGDITPIMVAESIDKLIEKYKTAEFLIVQAFDACI